MKYIIINDKSEKHENANYTDVNGNFFIIMPTTSNTSSGNVVITDDLSQYTLLPKIVAEQASKLEKIKNKAVKYLEAKLEKTLNSGVVIGQTGIAALSTGLILLGGAEDRNAFTQGTVLLNTAESIAEDKVAFQDLMISQIFGREIVDAQNVEHDMTVAQYKQLLVSYGQAIGAIQKQTLSVINQVRAATTKKEIDELLSKKKK